MKKYSRRLKGKTAVVTGAGAGIGKECALMMARHGAEVIGLELNQDAARDVIDEANTKGLSLEVIGGVDLCKPTQVRDAVKAVKERVNSVEILVNAAAYAVFGWLEDLSYKDWKQTLTSELDIVFLITKAIWPDMKSAESASIINFASVNAYHALEGSPALAHCAGKGGVLAMTRQLAMEGAPHGIRANTISPGFILTEATQRHLEQDPSLKQKVLAKNMVQRLGTPEDIAWLVVYLASDEASYVTGADFSVDAGATAW